MILVLRAVVHAPNAPGWPVMVLIAFGCGFVLAVGWPTLASMFPSEIIVSQKGINRNGIDGTSFVIEFFPWEEIGRFRFDEIQTRQAVFKVLVIENQQGQEIAMIGMSERAPISELEYYFEQQGKGVVKAR